MRLKRVAVIVHHGIDIWSRWAGHKLVLGCNQRPTPSLLYSGSTPPELAVFRDPARGDRSSRHSGCRDRVSRIVVALDPRRNIPRFAGRPSPPSDAASLQRGRSPCVRRGKARSPSGRQTHPATFAPAGSNRSSRGGNESTEAFDGKGHIGDPASPQAATCSERRAGPENLDVEADPTQGWGRLPPLGK